jgi:hypothetical protein
MNKLTRISTLGIAALATLALLACDTNTAEARGFGIHLGGRNVHLDIGNPHGYGGYSRQVSYRSTPTHRTYSNHTPHYDYHDTSHYDYHPGGYVRHSNHFDYQRGHFDFHRQGHYDFHGGGHHGGHH